jgi:ATP-binding cassette subfamily B protein
MSSSLPSSNPTGALSQDSQSVALNRPLPPFNEGEQVLAMLEPDLDSALRFAVSRVLLTTDRMISDSDGHGWVSWPLTSDLSLHHTDHAGVATLALHNAQSCLARWRFTLEQEVGAIRLMQQFERVQITRAGQALTSDEAAARCPSCQSALPEESEECPVCHRELLEPVSTWVLFRLWRFAKPYRLQLLLGLFLT